MPSVGHSTTRTSGPGGGSGHSQCSSSQLRSRPDPPFARSTGTVGTPRSSLGHPKRASAPTVAAFRPSANCTPRRTISRPGPPNLISGGTTSRLRIVRLKVTPLGYATKYSAMTATWSVRATSTWSGTTPPSTSSDGPVQSGGTYGSLGSGSGIGGVSGASKNGMQQFLPNPDQRELQGAFAARARHHRAPPDGPALRDPAPGDATLYTSLVRA